MHPVAGPACDFDGLLEDRNRIVELRVVEVCASPGVDALGLDVAELSPHLSHEMGHYVRAGTAPIGEFKLIELTSRTRGFLT